MVSELCHRQMPGQQACEPAHRLQSQDLQVAPYQELQLHAVLHCEL